MMREQGRFVIDNRRLPVKIMPITAIRVIFDGKAFIPQQTVSLPDFIAR